jgi:hypothetical protein
MSDDTTGDAGLADRLRTAFNDLQAELAPKLAELGDQVNAKVDELQEAVAAASTKLDQWQAERG